MAKRKDNWNILPGGTRYRVPPPDEPKVDMRANRIDRIIELARQLLDIVGSADMTADERAAAVQVFNVLHQRGGTK